MISKSLQIILFRDLFYEFEFDKFSTLFFINLLIQEIKFIGKK